MGWGKGKGEVRVRVRARVGVRFVPPYSRATSAVPPRTPRVRVRVEVRVS